VIYRCRTCALGHTVFRRYDAINFLLAVGTLHLTTSNNRSAEAVRWRFSKFEALAGSCLAAERHSTLAST
jgi:hypothetical protein